MKHRIGYNRLGRKASHRKAMLKNMATSLLRHERIHTTRARAKELRKVVEPLITRAKVDSVHNRRIAATTIADKEILAKLFNDIGPRFTSRPGGYTRILKVGQRQGDAADMVLIELVEEMGEASQAPKRKARTAIVETDDASESGAAGPETASSEKKDSPDGDDSTKASEESVASGANRAE